MERDGPHVERCARWCGLRGAPVVTLNKFDCQTCSRMWIEEGTLSDGAEHYRIAAGIPRFVKEAEGSIDRDTQESFGYEWEHFDRVLPDYDTEIDSYFGIVPQGMLRDAVVMDAGCGMGRWAR